MKLVKVNGTTLDVEKVTWMQDSIRSRIAKDGQDMVFPVLVVHFVGGDWCEFQNAHEVAEFKQQLAILADAEREREYYRQRVDERPPL